MRSLCLHLCVLALVACDLSSVTSVPNDGAAQNSGGNSVSGGTDVVGTGGVPASGGDPAPGSGGSVASGGGVVTGGAPTSGGMMDGTPRPLAPGEWSQIAADPDDEAALLYDPTQLYTFELEIAPEDLAYLDADPSREEYVPGTLRFQGETVENVGVRYKGSVGAFLPPCTGRNLAGFPSLPGRTGKCSVKLSFNKYVPKREFHGVRKLQFHSMNNDPSMLRDRLAYQMFRDNGVPAPRSTHAKLVINGELQGVFALVEAIDGRFTRSRFSDGGKGNLYKEIWPLHSDPQAYLNALETNEDEMPSVQGFVDFTSRVSQGDTVLAENLQWDAVMRYMAPDRVLINDDGPTHFYCAVQGQGNNPGGIGNHNYFWYQEELEPHFWLIPWDMDFVLQQGTIVNLPIEWRADAACVCLGTALPTSCDALFSAMRTHNAEFEAAVDAFIAGPFEKARVDALLTEWENQIAPAVMATSGLGGAPTASEWQQAVTRLRTLVDQARANRGTAY